MRKDKVVVIIPAYNAARMIAKTCQKISKKIVDEIIVVNDGSTDDTQKVLEKIGVLYLVHKKNKGYGASQKSGYRCALKRGGDIIIMLHADGQHDPKYIPALISYLKKSSSDLILGSRIKSTSDALKNGMPFYKVFFNRLLSKLQNIILGLSISEYHTGYRVFRRKVLETINFEKFSDDFIFDQEIILSARLHNFSIGEIFTSCIYNPDASSINFSKSVAYGLGIIKSLLLYLTDKRRYF